LTKNYGSLSMNGIAEINSTAVDTVDWRGVYGES
jgi:hypothetical protein